MKDIKTKPQGTPKINVNAPKSVSRVPNAVKDIKSVAKDNLIKNTIEKRLDDNSQPQQSERAEVYATENVESAAYNAADTFYHKGKTFAENKIKQRIQQVKTRENQQSAPQNANAPETPHSNETALSPSNAPKKADNTPKTRDAVQSDIPQTAPKQRNVQAERMQQKSAVKTKAEYIKAQRAETPAPDTVKTKENYIKQHGGQAELKDGIKQKPTIHNPKMREPVSSVSDTQNTSNTILSKTEKTITPPSNAPKTKAEAIKDARKSYVSDKLKTKAETEKQLQNGAKSDNSLLPKNDLVTNCNQLEATAFPPLQQNNVKTSALSPKTQNTVSVETDTAPTSKMMPKTKESYMKLQRQKNTADLIKTPDRNLTAPKQNTHTVSRSVSENGKKAVKPRQSVSKGRNAVKKGNAYVGKTTRKGAVKVKKAAAKTQKEITKKAAKQATKQAKAAAQKAAQVTKAAAKATAKVTVKVAQVVAAAVTKLVSALVAMGGWAVLLVVLIVVIIVAAIAASPFGIFISDEAADTDSIPISSIVAECNMELSTKLTEIEDAAAPDSVVMDGEQANWSEVLAVFSVKVAGTDDDTVQDVVVITEDKKQKLKDIFWEMNSISSHTETETKADGTTEKVLYITLNHKTKDDMINEYHFTARQQEALATLLENGDVLVGATQSLAISDATAQEVLHSLPDSLSQDRKNVIKAACSLVGKVNYFWGGKSAAIGWDSNWGKMTLVTAEGSRSSGSMRPFGLDCSGFVTWTFINAGKTAAAIGHGASTQSSKCTRISWSEAQPGDLAFLSDLSHVGIVAGKDASGNILVIHCSSGANNVVITSNSIFGFAGRPNCY